MKKRYVVRLTGEEREQLTGLVKRGREAAYRRRHAQVLLLADESEAGEHLPDREVAERVGCTRRTVEQIRERCVCEGLSAALERKPRSRERSRVLDGTGEARLVSIACSEPPEGYARWTLKLLSERLVELEVVESMASETVRQVLKKRHQTLAEAHVVHSSARARGLRMSNGRRAKRVPTTVGLGASRGLYG